MTKPLSEEDIENIVRSYRKNFLKDNLFKVAYKKTIELLVIAIVTFSLLWLLKFVFMGFLGW